MAKFRVLLTALASVHGYIEVEAKDQKAAEKKAMGKTGDVLWEYDGVDDGSVQAVDTKPA